MKLLLAILVVLCLAAGFTLFVVLLRRRAITKLFRTRESQHQKQLEFLQASIQDEDDERSRIARQLHDDVGATLSSVRLFLSKAEQNPTDGKLIGYSKTILDDLIQKVRSLSQQLQPMTLQHLGLARALESLVETISSQASIQFEFVQDTEEWPEPEPRVALMFYRVVQDLSGKIGEQANVNWMHVRMHREDNSYCVSMAYDGNRLPDTSYQELLHRKGAVGLMNIENRINSSDRCRLFPNKEVDYDTITVCLLG